MTKRRLHITSFPIFTPNCREVNLVNSAGLSDDQQRKDQICEVSRNGEICQVYKRPSPRPVVGLPLATEFNVVAMDLKQCEGGWILHLIDHVSRCSAAALIKSKRKEVIIEHIFKIRIGVFGPPPSHFSDNGGEFNNEEFREMGEAMNIVVKTTAAEAPWSNGLYDTMKCYKK